MMSVELLFPELRVRFSRLARLSLRRRRGLHVPAVGERSPSDQALPRPSVCLGDTRVGCLESTHPKAFAERSSFLGRQNAPINTPALFL
jgi:hypothetical protein